MKEQFSREHSMHDLKSVMYMSYLQSKLVKLMHFFFKAILKTLSLIQKVSHHHHHHRHRHHQKTKYSSIIFVHDQLTMTGSATHCV